MILESLGKITVRNTRDVAEILKSKRLCRNFPRTQLIELKITIAREITHNNRNFIKN